MKLNKSTLVNNINRDLADNATQEITPADVRQNMLDIVDSVVNLLVTEEIVTANFSTPATRTVIAGEEALSKLGQESYVTSDSVAVGYAALKQNFQGDRNTAVGSHALSCNVFGTDNIGVGYAALAGNSNGVGNVGVGNYSLYYGKLGNFNVAIGHGAGYYGDREASYKLYIGAHPVTEQYVCDNTEGSGLTPLVHGDFQTAQFGVNVNSFHPYGTVQVSGAISPSQDTTFDLGNSNYQFLTTHTKNIEFAQNTITGYDDAALAVVHSGVHAHAGDVDPLSHRVYALGDHDKQWHTIHTYNLNVSGVAIINEYTTITECLYECKTLYLATSGVCEGETSPCGYLHENSLAGAGLIIPASGDIGGGVTPTLLRDYEWTLTPRPAGGTPDPFSTLPYAGKAKTYYDFAHWTSNINIELEGQSHISAMQHVGSGNSTLFGTYTDTTGYVKGMYAQSGLYESISFVDFATVDSNNLPNITFADAHKSRYMFFISDGDENTTDSAGVGIISKSVNRPTHLRFENGTTSANRQGAEIVCNSSGITPGLFINTYDGTSPNNSGTFNTIAIMQNDATGGVLGVHNFYGESELRYPETLVNARGNGDAIVRVTAENAGDVNAGVELCGEENCLANAAEFVYNKPSGVAVIGTYLDSGRIVHQTFDTASGNTIFNNGNVQLGEDADHGILSFRDHASGSSANTQTGFTRLFSRHVDGKLNQASELVYVDTSGNVFPLSLSTGDNGSVYVDGNFNTFAGSGTPSSLVAIGSASGNTGFGTSTLHDITKYAAPQGFGNTALGFKAGSGLYDGNNNVVIGVDSLSASTSGVDNNIVIGNSINTISTSNNIIIGHGIGGGVPENSFILGSTSRVLLSGVMSSSSLGMPYAGSFSLYDANNVESLKISDHNITVLGGGSRYGNNPLTIDFSAGLSNTILTLDHSSHYTMSNSENYETTNPRRPFMHLDGDFRVRGAVRFADGTSFETASGINDAITLYETLEARINSQTVEGVMSEGIDPASSNYSPNSGIMVTLAGNSVWVVNRDKHLTIEDGDYVVATRVLNISGNDEYRPVWVSNEYNTCGCARPSTLDGGTL